MIPAGQTGPPVRVLVVDDQTLVRQGIRSLLGLAPAVEVVGEAADGAAALAAIDDLQPQVVLLDLRMPVCDGLGVLADLADRAGAGRSVPAVIVLTTFTDDEALLEAVGRGARGFLLKDVSLEQLVEAIVTVAAGDSLVQPVVTQALARRVAGRPALPDIPVLLPDLTGRERDVLGLMSGGYSNREIARALHLAEGTVKNHVSVILDKLGVRDRTRAALRALELGLVGTDG